MKARPAQPNRLLWAAVALAQEQSRRLRDESNESLRRWADDLRNRARTSAAGWKSKEISHLALAAVIEACRRVHGVELYDAQVLAGLLLGRGLIVEMQTGEGKTFAAALAAFLFALGGKGVHVVTPNAYLADRDFHLLRPVYELLGCTVGLLADGAPLESKRAAYASDITYGTGYDFGFDYLREQLAKLRRRPSRLGSRLLADLGGTSRDSQRPISRGFAIVDEIDSVLIDEACTPLVLSDTAMAGSADDRIYQQAIEAAGRLRGDQDFVVDVEQGSVWLTEGGRVRCYEEILPPRISSLARPWSEYVQQALQATQVLRRDVDYVVAGNQIVLVDAMTGRLCSDRSWRDGLHQMVEVKEGLRPSAERNVAAQVTRQRYFRQYGLLCGMSGTVQDAAAEFYQTYGVGCAVVPPRLPSQRRALGPRFFASSEAKYRAVVQSIRELHATGRPVLVGSRTIENSQRLANALAQAGLPFQLLDGRQNAAEAEVIARAGANGAVTIATNVAGRGTDIQLGPGVAELGGLHLIGLEHNDSARVDRQLIGRVARQGNPGSYQFFVSADDELIRDHACRLQSQLSRHPGDREVNAGNFAPQVLRAQRRAETISHRQRLILARSDRWRAEDMAELVQ